MSNAKTRWISVFDHRALSIVVDIEESRNVHTAIRKKGGKIRGFTQITICIAVMK
jgi:hypothetical protein